MLKGYLSKAFAFPKYLRAIRNRELIRMPIYITERCSSHCKTCGIWRKKNPIDMSVEMIRGILDSVDCKKADIVLQGGEPIMHPDVEEILCLLRERGCKYQLFSNGILADKLVYLVNKYDVPNVALSCDGGREAYKKARGVDNYLNIVRLLGDLNGLTRLEVSYIISSWNSRKDLLTVAKLSKRFGATLNIDVYDEIEYFGTNAPRMGGIYKADDLASFPKNKCLRLYNDWLKGGVALPCYSVRISCFITTDGGVYSCGRALVKLGDLSKQSLAEIWNSPHTVRVQDELTHGCNKCFSTCYRNTDVAFALVFPKAVLERLL